MHIYHILNNNNKENESFETFTEDEKEKCQHEQWLTDSKRP